MSTKLSVGFIQFDVTDNIDKNVSNVSYEIERIVRDKIDVIVLPELWSCGFNYRILDEAVGMTPDILATVSSLAQEHNVTIIGSLPEKKIKNIYNTAFVTDPNGKIISKYQKIHLFPPLKEDKHFAPGRVASVFTINGVTFGTAICFDIRFPELIRKLADQGMEVLVVCAQWPKIRYHQWITLLKARAIENQIFVVAVNRCGTQCGTEFLGHSVIVNPYGEAVYEAHEFEESDEALIDLSLIEKFKKQFDSLALRRPKTYETK